MEQALGRPRSQQCSYTYRHSDSICAVRDCIIFHAFPLTLPLTRACSAGALSALRQPQARKT